LNKALPPNPIQCSTWRFEVVAISETAFLVALLVWQAVRLAPAIRHDPAYLSLLVADGLPVVLVLLRRPAQAITQGLTDWLTAYGGAVAPILLTPGGHALVDPRITTVLMILGLSINLYGKACLARSFGLVAANRGVQLKGPYRLVRHPIYAGNAITQIGFVLGNPTALNFILCLTGITLQVIRLQAEEKLLGEDPVYAEYMARVPYRLAPGLY
jgi:protein-S-isoprenylcysteine O-methyltransferase Ste14